MNRKSKKLKLAIKIDKTINEIKNSVGTDLKNNILSSHKKPKTPSIYFLSKYFVFENISNEYEMNKDNDNNNYGFKKSISHEINHEAKSPIKEINPIVSSHNSSGFESSDNEEKVTNQCNINLKKKNKPKIYIDVNGIREEFKNENNYNFPKTEIYIINNEQEYIKTESKNKIFYKKIDTAKNEKNKEDTKEENNINNRRNSNNKEKKNIINSIEEESETTYEDSRNTGNNKNETQLNSSQIQKPDFYIPVNDIRKKEGN